jgi:sec-independent protein translocase protein TatC
MIRGVLIFSTFLLSVGSFIAYEVIIPLAFHFFTSFQQMNDDKVLKIQLQTKIHEYVILNTKLFFSLTLSFQFPIIFIIFSRLNFIPIFCDYTWFSRKRRFFYLLSAIIATFISPPDILSQLFLFLPLLLSFEMAFFCVKLLKVYDFYKININKILASEI